MYVPGLQWRLFFIAQFADHSHYAVIRKHGVSLHFDKAETKVTLPLERRFTMASNSKAIKLEAKKPKLLPETGLQINENKRIKFLTLELLYRKMGLQNCRSLIAASDFNVWQDVQVRMSLEPEMLTIGIATIRTTNRNTMPHTPAERRGESTFMNILPKLAGAGLTHHTTFDAFNIIVDAFNRFGKIYGLIDKSAEQVVISSKQ